MLQQFEWRSVLYFVQYYVKIRQYFKFYSVIQIKLLNVIKKF